MSPSFPGKAVLLVLCAAAVAAGAAVWWWFNHPSNPPEGPSNPGPVRSAQAGFRDWAREAGIAFRMNFLPAEQGENFKVNLYDHGCGVAVGDFDSDGHDDVYFCNQLGRNALYRNNGDGTFEDVTERAGVGLGDRICVGAAFADYDNDGKPDLYVTSTRGGNVLFHNEGNGTFKDVTKAAGLTLVAHSQTAAFFDFDNDGLLDLFVANTAKWTTDHYDRASHYYPGLPEFWELSESPREENALYRNKGNGTFENVTAQAGLKGKGWGGDVAVFDFDGDGWLDLLVTNMFGASQLYRNKHDGTFEDVTREVLGRTSFGAIGCKAFDFNNDGRLDLLIADMHSDMWLPPTLDPRTGTKANLKKKYTWIRGAFYGSRPHDAESEDRIARAFKLRYEDVVFGNTLFKKLPSGKFEEVSDKANVETWWPWGIAVGDFDNDGFEDVFLPSGMGHPWGYWPNALLMNNGDETFTDRAEALGIEPPPGGIYLEEKIGSKPAVRSSRCAAVLDLDGDGRLDLVVNNFNGPAYVFRNELPKQNYIAFRLTGTKSNRDAVGALVKVFVGQEVMVRQVQAAGGYLSQSSQVLHFGLGRRAKIDRVEVRWPRGGTLVIDHPAINTRHSITEGGPQNPG
jgi:hypothetical protein